MHAQTIYSSVSDAPRFCFTFDLFTFARAFNLDELSIKEVTWSLQALIFSYDFQNLWTPNMKQNKDQQYMEQYQLSVNLCSKSIIG
jgi:hypothetical protein